jgi:hypothetical protein
MQQDQYVAQDGERGMMAGGGDSRDWAHDPLGNIISADAANSRKASALRRAIARKTSGRSASQISSPHQ